MQQTRPNDTTNDRNQEVKKAGGDWTCMRVYSVASRNVKKFVQGKKNQKF